MQTSETTPNFVKTLASCRLKRSGASQRPVLPSSQNYELSSEPKSQVFSSANSVPRSRSRATQT